MGQSGASSQLASSLAGWTTPGLVGFAGWASSDQNRGGVQRCRCTPEVAALLRRVERVPKAASPARASARLTNGGNKMHVHVLR